MALNGTIKILSRFWKKKFDIKLKVLSSTLALWTSDLDRGTNVSPSEWGAAEKRRFSGPHSDRFIPQAWADDVERFQKMFRHPDHVQLKVVVGNHDIGFHYQ